MHFAIIQRILGLIVVASSLTMMPPVVVSLMYADGDAMPFLIAVAVALPAGVLLWWPVRRVERDLRLRDGFLVVALFWLVLISVGALPLVLSRAVHLSVTDAVFEAVSGFTTTGLSVLSGIEHLPKSLLWYRQQMQWVGGVGIIVLAIALFPVLGIGGMQLYKSETPGPVKDEKLTPRVMQSARALWVVYVLITAACAACFWSAGMDGFDAIAHAFSTVSTGGFSTYDASLGHWNSFAIDMIAVAFMFLGGVNFAMHYLAYRRMDWRTYFDDPQFRGYLVITLVLIAVVTVYLLGSGTYPTLALAFRYAALQVVSMQTTTGFQTADFALWPGALPALLILITFVGGCAGSTAGGMKVIRWQLVLKAGSRELKRLVHPNAQLPVKYADKPVQMRVLGAVTGYFAIYLLLFGLMMLLLMATGLDQVSAWSAIASCINNAGPALGALARTFQSVSDAGKWVCICAMLIGRLEVFTVILLVTPTFWRK